MAPRKEVTLSLLTFLILVVVALGLAYSYRFQGLELRPMHTDEAILGMKLAETWNTGHFTYDPKDFHGPALHQVSLLWSKLAGWGDPTTWTEANLRMVTVMCSMALLLVTLLFADALGRYGTAIAMLLMASSPMMVFYSRYFIMEMLLVLLIALTLGCFWRYSQGGTRLWLVLGGCALGFQHATKETFILNVGAAVVGWLVARSLIGEFEPRKASSFSIGPARKKGRPARPWLWVALPAVFISVAAFSNGFKDWQAVGDSFLTYLHYLERSGGSGHEKPWHYYISLIFWRKDTLIWTEALIGGLALIGMIYAFIGDFKNTGRQAFLVFLSVYSLVLLMGYSVLSYKTPWSILSAQHAFILLAGLGAGALWSAMPGAFMRWVYNILLGLGILHLCNQSLGLTGTHPNPQLEYSADPRNPYAYSHTQKSLLKLLAEVNTYVGDQGDTKTIQVISRDSGWPLPWYWRNWKKVGYQDRVPENLDADVIVVDGEFYDQVKARINAANYTEHYPYGLRPGIILSVLLRKAPAPAPVPAVPPPAASPAPTPTPAPADTSPAKPAPETEAAVPPPPPEGTLSQPPSFSPSLPNLPGGLVPQPQL
ncbi:TIGR03663 family protein [Prosthecobacter debontii]|uniref:TIGR03663 family protein n=1 Tax=Prosthecobacter debontii TaxID=48467 RepID=A0A1T4YKM2_9BACT|nr:flippase activity-associated protein Agl23 [Prosthecobacter debontii]SKB02349.1 TIGR03663 family protein [Prosthecobacter debontii]